jgi:hypothetical protein
MLASARSERVMGNAAGSGPEEHVRAERHDAGGERVTSM